MYIILYIIYVKHLIPAEKSISLAIPSDEQRKPEQLKLKDFKLKVQTALAVVFLPKIWGCLKIGYIPNYSHLIGIMISKTIGFRGTLFSDTPIWQTGSKANSTLAKPKIAGN